MKFNTLEQIYKKEPWVLNFIATVTELLIHFFMICKDVVYVVVFNIIIL